MRSQGDEGSAAVEFLAVGVLLLVPIAYLVLTLGRVQAATFAAESAAREATRVLATTPGPAGARRAQASIDLALADQGVPDSSATVSVECSAQPCRSPQAEIAVTVRLSVDLPLVPGVLADAVPARVPVQVRRVAVVDRFTAP